MDVNFFFKFWLNYAMAIVDFSHRLDPVLTEVMPLIRPSRLDSACSSIFSNKRTLLSYLPGKALLRLASKDGKAEYKEKIVDAKIGIVDIVAKLCPSIEMSLEHFISVCPCLHPRYYTISSSSTLHPQSIHVTVSVRKDEREDGSSFKGVFSNYLADLIDGRTTKIVLRWMPRSILMMWLRMEGLCRNCGHN